MDLNYDDATRDQAALEEWADAEQDDLLGTVRRFPGERRVVRSINEDHNGRFHYLAEELFTKARS